MDADDLWIFAYGSLMWRPDFAHVERRRARLNGYHRALCIFSSHWRGTVERPGLVLGLDRGGSCVGVAFRVAREERDTTLAAVRAREQVTNVYHEAWAEVRLDDGRRVRSVVFVANRRHVQYAGRLDREQVIERVRTSAGEGGPNIDYVRNTCQHLTLLGVADPSLGAIVAAIDGGAPASVAPD